MTAPTGTVARARTDFADHRWTAAVAGFEEAGGFPVIEPQDAERLAWSVTWTGQPVSVCLDAFERTEAAFRHAGNGRGASRAALEQARINALLGNDLVSAGCWARALDHIGGDDGCAEYGMAMALGAYARLIKADVDGVRELAGVAEEIGRRVNDPTVEAMGSYLLGHGAILAGDIAGGLDLLDRTMSVAMTGVVHLMYAGTIYCGLLWACREIGDWPRAAQWHEVASRWCQREAVVHFPAHLNAHRAELLRAQGRLEEAERASRAALELAGDWHRDLTAWAYAQVGEARLRLGDLEGADVAFARSSELGYHPEPGRARLLCLRGKPEEALRSITQAIERPHWYAFSSLIYTLPVGVSIALDLGELDTAARWYKRLQELAETYGTPGPRASAQVARGEIALAQRRIEDAIDDLQGGKDAWLRTGAPYEVAHTRVLLARAYEADLAEDAARLELEAALSTFDRIGARGDEQRIRTLLFRTDTGRRAGTALDRRTPDADDFDGLTPRQRQVAALVARGLTNGQIAEELIVSRHTAEAHVKHILAQLGFSSRAQVAAWASHKGLIEPS